jgi:YidC/Oxa1 family membrane protein insertase
MEKRALIAFLLSLLVLVFWEYYFGLFHSATPPPQQQSEQAAPTSTQPPAPKTAPPPASTPQALPQALPKDHVFEAGQHFQSWTISDPLYRMSIIAPGGRLDSFELKKYRKTVDPESPPMQMVTSQASGYLPMAIDLLHHQDWELSTKPFSSEAGAETVLADQKSQVLSFSTEVPGKVRITKSFTCSPDSYVIDLEVQLQNLSAERLVDQMGISFYFQPFSPPAEESSYNQSQLTVLEKGSLKNHTAADLAKSNLTLKPPMTWVAYENNFFINAIIPVTEGDYQVVPRVLDAEKGLLQLVYLTDSFQIEGNETKSFKLRLYIGPKELHSLALAENQLTSAVDYGWFTIIAKPLVYVMEWFYRYTHNYGIAIILLTILIKILFWPLTQKSYQSMQKMKKIQPKIAQVREKYKGDREKMNQEMMGLYKTYKVNPMGGCLPMVLQIPVFFALYRMLNAAVELRHEPFMLWINDLTAPDRLNIGFDIPYLGGLPVLTLLMGITMFIQQKMTPSGGDPRQEQIMLIMPVMFTVFFVNFPSGLVLYWLVNNVLSIAQQYWINRRG